jgi:hypothetical protein
VRSRVARLRVRDFGSCSRRAADAGGLFVEGIGPDRNSGQDGWVYKVGRKLATAGSADPDGPFGRGLLRRRTAVTWFYCRLRNGTCQRTLSVAAGTTTDGTTVVSVAAYDDEGRSSAAAGATVHIGSITTTASSAGVVRMRIPSGRHHVYAEKAGNIRSASRAFVVP